MSGGFPGEREVATPVLQGTSAHPGAAEEARLGMTLSLCPGRSCRSSRVRPGTGEGRARSSQKPREEEASRRKRRPSPDSPVNRRRTRAGVGFSPRASAPPGTLSDVWGHCGVVTTQKVALALGGQRPRLLPHILQCAGWSSKELPAPNVNRAPVEKP